MTPTDTPAPITASKSIIANQLGFMPTVRHFTAEDGTACVAVPLCGLHGAGNEVLMDHADWHHGSTTISPWWQMTRSDGIDYVTCSNTTAIAIAVQTSKVKALFLARYLVKPDAGRFVRFVNGDRLDCRRANLTTLSRSEHSLSNVAAMRFNRMQQWSEAAAMHATVSGPVTAETRRAPQEAKRKRVRRPGAKRAAAIAATQEAS